MDLDKMEEIRLKVPAIIPESVRQFIKSQHNSYTMFVSYWQKYEDSVIRRTFAFKNPISKPQQITEVMREVPEIAGAMVQNCYLSSMSGYVAVYKPETRRNYYGYCPFDKSDFNKWYNEPDRYGITVADELNTEIFGTVEKFKHCGYTRECGNPMTYLRQYLKNPSVEFFGKLGIKPYPSYINLAKKDRQFIRFLKDNLQEVKRRFPECVIYTYKHRLTFEEASHQIATKRRALQSTIDIKSLAKTGIDRIKVCDYLAENKEARKPLYDDYIEAIKYLKLDLTDSKNVFPKQFKRMHDLRIDQMHSQKAREDAERRQALYEAFKAKMSEYGDISKGYEGIVIVLPESPADLIREGDILSHCVGKMGYDKKVADGKSIIAFIRKAKNPDKPFVTIEYGVKQHKILQCYGEHDSNPGQKIKEIADDWAEFVTKKLKEAS